MQNNTSVSDLVKDCTHKHICNAAKKLWLFCGRYKLDRRPEHSTETSVVFLASQKKKDADFVPGKSSGQRVAIKFMVAKASYEREITVRERLNKNITVRERLNTNRCSRTPCSLLPLNLTVLH